MAAVVPPQADRAEAMGEAIDAILGASTTRSTFVVIGGPAGVGRTALLQRITERLTHTHPDIPVLRATGLRWESTIPFGVLRQLIPHIEIPAPPADPLAIADAVALSITPSGDARPRPTVIMLDDAHDADAESLRALASTVRHHRDLLLTVVCARRPPPDGTTAAHEILDHAGDVAVTLPPLRAAEIADIAAAQGVVLTPAASAHLARHTGGRPRPVLALLDEVPRGVWKGVRPDLPAPHFVDADVRERLSQCDDETRRLVQCVAILAGADLSVVCAMAGIDNAWATIDAAESSGVVTVLRHPTATILDTRDPMIRAAVMATMTRSHVAELHRAAAAVVDDHASALIHLAEAAALPDRAMSDRLQAHAVDCGARGEWATAARLYELSSRSTTDRRDREDRLIRAVDALIGAGDVPTASGYVAEVESLQETPLRDSVLGYLAILRGRPQEADARLRRAWEMVRVRREPDVAAMVCHREVLHNLARCNGALLVAWADRAVELVGADDPTAVEAQSIRGLGLGGTGRVAEALSSYQDLWGHTGTGAVGQRVQMGAGWLHLATDHVELARAELEAAAPTDFLGGSTRISVWAHAWLARAYFVTGDWDAALRTVRAGADLVERSGAALILPLLQWTATQIHALRGDWDAAEASARIGDAGPRDYEIMRVPAALARAAIAEARADYAGVVRALTPLTETWAQSDVAEPGFWPWPDVYANALVVEGRLAEAEAFLGVHDARIADRGHRSAQARLACARIRLQGARGDLTGARESFDAALAALDPLPLVYDRARVDFAYGQTLRRAGKRRDADVVISAARDGYLSIGATTYVRRCDRELKAGGVHAVLKDRAHDALTPQEDAVAHLVATGMTNREAAAELYLSVKTVQFHLTRVYAKLGIRSRSELAATHAADRTATDT